MTRKKITHLICDFDGTIASFHFWFCPALREIVAYVASVLGVSQEEIGVELARNMRKAESHECTFPFMGPYFKSKWHGTNDEFVKKLTGPYFEILDSMRDRYLVPHPGALEALEEARRLGVHISLLSDATLYATMAKAVILKLQPILCGVYALDYAPPAAEDIWNQADYDFCRDRAQRYLKMTEQFPFTSAIHWTEAKPKTGGIKMVMRDCGQDPERTAVIGDSLLKDGGVAHAMAMRFVWARYGATDYAPPEYRYVLETLLNDKVGKPFTWVPTPKVMPPVHIEAPTFGAVVPLLRRSRHQSTLIKAS